MNIFHGIDIVNTNRKEFTSLNLIKRILHQDEYQYYLNLNNNAQSRYITKMWAIKEALFKAYNHNLPMNQVKILKEKNQLYWLIDNFKFIISVSYEQELVVASVIGYNIYKI